VGINLRKLKSYQEPFWVKLKEKLPDVLADNYLFSLDVPEIPSQYWEWVLTTWTDDEAWKHITLGYMHGTGRIKNSELDINGFFQTNSSIMSDLAEANFNGLLNDLASIFLDAWQCFEFDDDDEKEFSGLVINLYSHIVGGNTWQRGVLEEYILIIHESEKEADKISIGCQQNERYKLKVEEEDGINFYQVPFDKVNRFKGHERVEGFKNDKYFEYEVALSFAGENRAYVQEIANILRQKRVRLFYDNFNSTELWGKDLYVHLDEVYRKRSKYCVLFLSQEYKEKVWTNHERESVQARAFEENKEYMLPVKLDNTEIPGIRPTTGYVDGTRLTPKEVAEMIYRKVNGLQRLETWD
jgi:hypothetical protein